MARRDIKAARKLIAEWVELAKQATDENTRWDHDDRIAGGAYALRQFQENPDGYLAMRPQLRQVAEGWDAVLEIIR